MRSVFPLFTLVFVVACNGGETDETDTSATCGAPYEPFLAANYEAQLQRVAAYEQIVATADASDFSASSFSAMATLYTTAELNAKVAGRTDDHAYASTPAIGASLDADIQEALTAGAAGTDIDVQAQIIEKTLQRFFALSVYHEGRKAADAALTAAEVAEGWDEGFGYFGVSNDGAIATGVARTLENRDLEFGLSLVDTAFNGLIDGRCALDTDDRAAALTALETVDRAILTGLAASVVHEMDEYAVEADVVKFREAELYWAAVKDATNEADAAAATTIQAELDSGPDDVDPAAVREAMVTAWGLSF